jgi:hypothetical protein
LNLNLSRMIAANRDPGAALREHELDHATKSRVGRRWVGDVGRALRNGR